MLFSLHSRRPICRRVHVIEPLECLLLKIACCMLSHFYNHDIASPPPTRPSTDSCVQGVVGFYDARDLTSCSGTCSWTPRAGTLGPLTGTASISDGWVMNPRMSTTGNTGITGSQAHTSMVGFKLSDGSSSATRTLVQLETATSAGRS